LEIALQASLATVIADGPKWWWGGEGHNKFTKFIFDDHGLLAIHMV
jgi:hypothetical protein